MAKKIIVLAIGFLLFFGGAVMALELTSPVFNQGLEIPKTYSCQGENVSPQLDWKGVPEGTRSFVLINDDPDAPMGIWVHWVVYDMPASLRSLPEGIEKKNVLADGSKQGMTDFGRVGYGGPCPPPGSYHRYFFKLYALDIVLNIDPGKTKDEVLKAIGGHVLGQAELMGKFKR